MIAPATKATAAMIQSFCCMFLKKSICCSLAKRP
jgi:hypothetical protein